MATAMLNHPARILLPTWDRSLFIPLLRDALDALPIGAQAGAGLVRSPLEPGAVRSVRDRLDRHARAVQLQPRRWRFHTRYDSTTQVLHICKVWLKPQARPAQ